jgi:ankyrin repeat protein
MRVVPALILSGARDVPDVFGTTAICEAAMRGGACLMEQFLNSHADVNVPSALDDQTPLIQAVFGTTAICEAAMRGDA